MTLTETLTSTLENETLTTTLTATPTPPTNGTTIVPKNETPDTPENVTSPVSPESPEKPTSPETPEEPETPDKPENVTSPVSTETPEKPDAPESPQGEDNATAPGNDSIPGNATLPSGRVLPPDGANDTTHVNVSVRNVTPGEPIPVDVSPPANASNRTTVGVRQLTVEPTDGDAFSLNVTTGDAPLSTTPAFDPGTGTLELGYIRVNHTIPDSDIDHVNFTFRVNRSTLNATGTPPDEVVLYRFSNGSWSPVPTRVVEVTDQSVVLEARSPGLSDFLVGAQQPKFKIAKALVSASAITTGDDVAVRVRITNIGKADGSYTVKLKIDQTVVAERDITVAANGTRQVTFTRTFEQAGIYTVLVNQEFAGEVNVTRENLGTAAPTTTRPRTTARGLGFGGAVAVSALLAVIGLFGRRF